MLQEQLICSGCCLFCSILKFHSGSDSKCVNFYVQAENQAKLSHNLLNGDYPRFTNIHDLQLEEDYLNRIIVSCGLAMTTVARSRCNKNNAKSLIEILQISSKQVDGCRFLKCPDEQ